MCSHVQIDSNTGNPTRVEVPLSTQNHQITPLEPDDIMESPVATMWKWHAMNDLLFQVADTIEGCFIHRDIAVEILGKAHTSKSNIDGGILNKVRRHKHDGDLVLYGDLLKVKKQKHEEEKEGASSE